MGDVGGRKHANAVISVHKYEPSAYDEPADGPVLIRIHVEESFSDDISGGHRHDHHPGLTLPDDTTNEGRRLSPGHQRRPQLGYLRRLSHGHGHVAGNHNAATDPPPHPHPAGFPRTAQRPRGTDGYREARTGKISQVKVSTLSGEPRLSIDLGGWFRLF